MICTKQKDAPKKNGVITTTSCLRYAKTSEASRSQRAVAGLLAMTIACGVIPAAAIAAEDNQPNPSIDADAQSPSNAKTGGQTGTNVNSGVQSESPTASDAQAGSNAGDAAQGSTGGDDAQLKPGADADAQPTIPITAQGSFDSNEDAYWALNEEGLLSITGSGPIGFEDAFAQNDKAITSVFIGKGITEIETDTFCFLSSLKNVSFEENSSFSCLGMNAFGNCQSLESITLPASTKTIMSGAFSGCYALMAVDFGGEDSQLEVIGASAFNNCELLSSITLPPRLVTIESYAFIGCDSLTSITIPASVKTIEPWAFEDCTSLTNVTVENKTGTVIKPGAFANTSYRDLESAAETSKPAKKKQKISIKRLKVMGKGKLRVRWSLVDDAKSYTIKYKKKKAKTYKKLLVKNSITKKTTLKKLVKGRKYQVIVTANKKANGKKLICSSSKKTSKRIK